jgi:hypothetical protein
MPFLVGIGAFVLGTLIGSAGDGNSGTTAGPAAGGQTATATAPGKTVSKAAKLGPTVTVTEKATEPAAQDGEISDGQYEVGTDIEPGRWKTTTKAEDNGSLWCYADVQLGGDYLAQEMTPKGYTIVNVPNKRGAIFTSKSCGNWKKIG